MINLDSKRTCTNAQIVGKVQMKSIDKEMMSVATFASLHKETDLMINNSL